MSSKLINALPLAAGLLMLFMSINYYAGEVRFIAIAVILFGIYHIVRTNKQDQSSG